MYQKQFAEYFDKHMDEILRDLDEIISIESVGDIRLSLVGSEMCIRDRAT